MGILTSPPGRFTNAFPWILHGGRWEYSPPTDMPREEKGTSTTESAIFVPPGGIVSEPIFILAVRSPLQVSHRSILSMTAVTLPGLKTAILRLMLTSVSVMRPTLISIREYRHLFACSLWCRHEASRKTIDTRSNTVIRTDILVGQWHTTTANSCVPFPIQPARVW